MSTIQHIVYYEPKTSLIQTLLRILLGTFVLYAGIGHLTFSRQEFLAQVPTWIPLDGDFVVIWSGVVEIILGSLLIVLHKYRSLMGLTMAIFFILIFPGNISQYTNGIDAFGLDTDRDRFLRLFFQPVLITWALWSSGTWGAWRERPKN